MYCLITKRKSKQKPIPSGVYRNAVWQPIFPGSDDFCFSGQEILRPTRHQFRIALQEILSEDGKRRKKVWQVAVLDYWEIVDDYLDTLRTPWHRQASVWGMNEGKIVEGLRRHFPHGGQRDYRRYLAIIMAKFAPIKAGVIDDYRGSEEYPLQKKRINGGFGNGQADRVETTAGQEGGENRKNRRFGRVMDGLVSYKLIKNKALAKQVIVAGYRTLAHKCHPDKGGGCRSHARADRTEKPDAGLARRGGAWNKIMTQITFALALGHPRGEYLVQEQSGVSPAR